MTQAVFSAPTGAAVTLTAATAKTVLAWQAPAEHGLLWRGYDLGLTGVIATEPAVLVELCMCTFATAGTGTGATETQECGRTVAVPGSAFYGYSAEPTVLVPFRQYTLTPVGGTILWDWSEGLEPDCDASKGFAIRITPGATITATLRGSLRVARL